MTDGEQTLDLPGLARAEAKRAKPPAPKKPVTPAEVDPIARVLVDLPLAHLDRPFDYLVPDKHAATAVPGARVKVRFAGQDVDGFVLARAAETDHTGRLQPLRRVVSSEPVLTPDVARLLGLVARRYAGTRSDVLRLAVPPRHAAVEKEEVETSGTVGFEARFARTSTNESLAAGESPRVVWTIPPGDDGLASLADAVAATAASGRGALACVPDQRDLARLDAALTERLGEGRHVVLTAEVGPAARYRAFLKVSRGHVKVVIGTRAAAFAPVQDLGLVALWDDGDDLYAEPRAPYPHTREVLLMRAQDTGCAAVLAAHARSVEAAYLVTSGWATEVVAPREELRERVQVGITGDSEGDLLRDPLARTARLPREVFQVIKDGVEKGPVLLQTPRAGYAIRLACDTCRTPVRCERCQGPLAVTSSGAAPRCGWCSLEVVGWSCAVCGGRGLRAPVLGDLRTAEEIGRALPGVAIRTSSGDSVVATVPDRPAVVVATNGAEPVAEGGYAAVVLLDTWLLLARQDLRAAEEAVRRWANAGALVRPGGQVLLVGDPALPPLQAMVRWDPPGFALREMAERHSAHLPPASRVATLTMPAAIADEVLGTLALPDGAEVLGPVPMEDEEERYVVRVPRRLGSELSDALIALQVHRSTRKLPHVRIQVDPYALG